MRAESSRDGLLFDFGNGKGNKLHHRKGLFHFLTHRQILPSHKISYILGILNPTELPGNVRIKQGYWIYEEEKEMLASKKGS